MILIKVIREILLCSCIEMACIRFCIADEEEKKVCSIAEEVKKKQRDCKEDLVKAEPALLAAQVCS